MRHLTNGKGKGKGLNTLAPGSGVLLIKISICRAEAKHHTALTHPAPGYGGTTMQVRPGEAIHTGPARRSIGIGELDCEGSCLAL